MTGVEAAAGIDLEVRAVGQLASGASRLTYRRASVASLGVGGKNDIHLEETAAHSSAN
jgi:hypothetical protein